MKKKKYINESVRNEGEDLLNVYTLYAFIILQEEHSRELRSQTEGRVYKLVQNAIQEGKAETVSDAIDYIEKEQGDALYKPLADSPDGALGTLQRVVLSSSRHFLDTRADSFRLAFLPYVEEVLLAGLRSGILLCSWWRLVNYGFSVEPYDDKADEVALFPYRSISEMPRKDREAFRLLAEDYFSELESLGGVYHVLEGWREPDEEGRVDYSFRPYPKDGFLAEEIARQHSYKGEEALTVEELYKSWEYETELYIPFLVFRFDEALYYAMKYPGREYLDYVHSLNAREDWDENYGDTEYSYDKIFGEEA